MKTVIIADDNLLIAESIKNYIELLNYKVIKICRNNKEIILEMEKNIPDIIFLDISMESETDGIETCKEIKKLYKSVFVIFLTGYPIETLKGELKNIKYDGFLEKPVSFDTLKKTLRSLMV